MSDASQSDAASSSGSGSAESGDRSRIKRAKERAVRFKAERDQARRALDGATAQLEGIQSELRDAREEIGKLRDQTEQAAGLRKSTDEQVQQAVERAERRARNDRARVEDDLTAARREADELRQRVAALEAERRARPSDSSGALPRGRSLSGQGVGGPPGSLGGAGVATTGQHRDALDRAGTTIVVDGYNVTKRFRAEQPLELQRTWLEDLVRARAASAASQWVIVYDGDGRGQGTRRGNVGVQFAAGSVTADDEIDLFVAAQPAPEDVIVVSDDAELRARVATHGAQLLRVGEFVGALRR